MCVFSTLFFEQPVLSWAKQVGAYSAYKHPTALLTTLKPALTHCDAAPVCGSPSKDLVRNRVDFQREAKFNPRVFSCWPYTRWLFIPFQLFRKVMEFSLLKVTFQLKTLSNVFSLKSGTKYNSKKPQGLVGRLSSDMRGCLTFIFFNFSASWKSSSVWQAVETVAGFVSLDQIWRSEQNTLVMKSTNQWSHF